MRYPSEKNLVPLAEQFVKDHPNLKLLSNGKITNGKRCMKRIITPSLYDLGKMMYADGFIERRAGRYHWVETWKGLAYPYVRIES